jgi:hypothetical protein
MPELLASWEVTLMGRILTAGVSLLNTEWQKSDDHMNSKHNSLFSCVFILRNSNFQYEIVVFHSTYHFG